MYLDKRMYLHAFTLWSSFRKVTAFAVLNHSLYLSGIGWKRFLHIGLTEMLLYGPVL